MAKRRSVVTHQSEIVQGEGSYVKLSAVKVREVKKARQLAKTEEVDAFIAGLSMLKNHIVEWNWVDDDEKPLALPKNNPEVLDDLTNDEVEFLVELLMGTPKN